MNERPDAVRRTHSVWFHFTKEPRYFAGVDEIREPQKYPDHGQIGKPVTNAYERATEGEGNLRRGYQDERQLHPLGRLPGSVWTIPSDPLPELPNPSTIDHKEKPMTTTPPLRPDAVIDYQDDTAAVIRHDARNLPLDDESVDLIVTSPPYFALRSYRDDGEHYDGQIGSEDTPDQWLDALDECMVEWGRVLKPGGSIWLNLGDKYAGSQPNSNWSSAPLNHGAGVADSERLARQDADLNDEPVAVFGDVRAKSLMGLPWRVAIRQIDNGWILRAEVIWDKPNGLPESVTDRVRRSHEQWFHFVKEPRYFSGIDEIREPHAEASLQSWPTTGPNFKGNLDPRNDPDTQDGHRGSASLPNPLGRLPGSVWTIPSEPLLIPDETRQALDLPDHFAAFPQEWPRRIITGWSPTGICTECGEGRRPVIVKNHTSTQNNYEGRRQQAGVAGAASSPEWIPGRDEATITGYVCACPTPDAPTTPAVVLDPMGGTGTVAGVARMLGRYGITNDMSEDYNRLAVWRIWSSGHFVKTEQRAWADRQTTLL